MGPVAANVRKYKPRVHADERGLSKRNSDRNILPICIGSALIRGQFLAGLTA
jgi:hypothetical protein